MTRKAVTILRVADPVVFAELDARLGLSAHLRHVSPLEAELTPDGERALLAAPDVEVLVRYARRTAAERAARQADLGSAADRAGSAARRVLREAARHALDGVVVGRQAWDPVSDAASVRALVGAGLLTPEGDPTRPYEGLYRLDPDLPPPAEVDYDFTEAVMPETDDLSASGPAVVTLLHDVASLAAALVHAATTSPVALTHAGEIRAADSKRLGRHLGDAALVGGTRLEAVPRWGQALRALHALGAATVDPLGRTLHVDAGLEDTLAGTAEQAADRLIHKLVDRDLHTLVPAVRAALAQAGSDALDEVVFLDELRAQHRDVLFPAWHRGGQAVYPHLEGETPRPYDDDGFDAVESRMVGAALRRMARIGLIRRAPGVFAGTADGRRWAGATRTDPPPVWITGDLELIVPPDAVTPWERFQLERLCRALSRDTVDHYRLDRDHLVAWLTTHDVEEALALLRRRAPAVPAAVEETLRTWAAAAERVVLVRGVLVTP